jgi:hypothetical protein
MLRKSERGPEKGKENEEVDNPARLSERQFVGTL